MNYFIYLILLGMTVFGHGSCPRGCICGTDERGRKQILCRHGGFIDPIPISNMDRGVEVLEISGTEDVPNFLTIGPIFQQFYHLHELHITRSNIPAIGKFSFWSVPTLNVLNLSHNNISHLLDHNFRGLVNLTRLHLDQNRIESMPSETFRYLRQLRILTLTKNRISHLVPRVFLNLGKLQELDLSQNPISHVDSQVLQDVTSLKILRCRFCLLSTANTFNYKALVHLMELDLGGNQFKYVQSEEFHLLPRLQILNLDQSQVINLTEMCSQEKCPITARWSELKVLNLSRNNLTKLGIYSLAKFSQLQVLDLSYNQLTELESQIFQVLGKSLEMLNLSGNTISGNQLKSIVDTCVANLRHLSLADMKLSEVSPELLINHEKLRFLNLSGNYIFHLSPNLMKSFRRLRSLDLSRNRFRGLTEKAMTNLERIEHLVLTDNPWACDLCHVPSILNRVNSSKMSIALRELTCKTPERLFGKKVVGLQGSDLEWCTGRDLVAAHEETGLGVAMTLLPDHLRTALIVALVILMVLVLLGVTRAGLALNSRHRTRHYYTGEGRISRADEAWPELPHSQVYSKSILGSGHVQVPNKKASIATIEEFKVLAQKSHL